MSVSSQGRGRDNRPVQNTFQTWVGLAATTIIVIAIILLATAAGHAAAALFDVLSEIHEPRAFAAGEIESLITARVAASLFAFQAVTVICVLLVNAYRRRVIQPSELLDAARRASDAGVGRRGADSARDLLCVAGPVLQP